MKNKNIKIVGLAIIGVTLAVGIFALSTTSSVPSIWDSLPNEVQELIEKQDSDYEAQLNDVVAITYVGKKDGTPFEGGTANDPQILVLGSGQYIPGFEEGLVGHKVGEEVDLELTFPEDYHSEDLAGADVVFTVEIHEIYKFK